MGNRRKQQLFPIFMQHSSGTRTIVFLKDIIRSFRRLGDYLATPSLDEMFIVCHESHLFDPDRKELGPWLSPRSWGGAKSGLRTGDHLPESLRRRRSGLSYRLVPPRKFPDLPRLHPAPVKLPDARLYPQDLLPDLLCLSIIHTIGPGQASSGSADGPGPVPPDERSRRCPCPVFREPGTREISGTPGSSARTHLSTSNNQPIPARSKTSRNRSSLSLSARSPRFLSVIS